MNVNVPAIVVDSDYDGYFERLVRRWVEQKAASPTLFKHREIHVSAGPYRSSAVTYRSGDGVLTLDFYSALRAGFGSLPEADIAAIQSVL